MLWLPLSNWIKAFWVWNKLISSSSPSNRNGGFLINLVPCPSWEDWWTRTILYTRLKERSIGESVILEVQNTNNWQIVNIENLKKNRYVWVNPISAIMYSVSFIHSIFQNIQKKLLSFVRYRPTKQVILYFFYVLPLVRLCKERTDIFLFSEKLSLWYF